jgi:hypothetical protein
MYRTNAKPETNDFKDAHDPIIIDEAGNWFDRYTADCWTYGGYELWVTKSGNWLFKEYAKWNIIKDLQWIKRYFFRYHSSNLPEILKEQLAVIEQPGTEL